jgi:hypothetical protein
MIRPRSSGCSSLKGQVQQAAHHLAEYFNKTAAVVRAAVEQPFALMKGPYVFSRCRYIGLARNDAHLQLFASRPQAAFP